MNNQKKTRDASWDNAMFATFANIFTHLYGYVRDEEDEDCLAEFGAEMMLIFRPIWTEKMQDCCANYYRWWHIIGCIDPFDVDPKEELQALDTWARGDSSETWKKFFEAAKWIFYLAERACDLDEDPEDFSALNAVAFFRDAIGA